jgi:hypothetical protein
LTDTGNASLKVILARPARFRSRAGAAGLIWTSALFTDINPLIVFIIVAHKTTTTGTVEAVTTARLILCSTRNTDVRLQIATESVIAIATGSAWLVKATLANIAFTRYATRLVANYIFPRAACLPYVAARLTLFF